MIHNKIRDLLSPIEKILLSFVVLIFTGALLLLLPCSTVSGISFIDALFTSTSAVCVTGLVVLDTAKDFTFFGQVIILFLIQFGGLGIMTFSIAMLTVISGSISIKWRFTFESFYSDIRRLPIKSLLIKVVKYTFIIELTVAVILFTQFIKAHPFPEAVWHSLFHAISGFCNAGFSTFSDNLVSLNTNTVVLLAIGIDIILGGLGFLVLSECVRLRFRGKAGIFSQLTLHSKFAIVITLILIFGGMAGFLILEWKYCLTGFSLKDKLLNSFFQSVTCRTAGYNSVHIGSLRECTLLMMIALMFTGGSPGSIAGGVKTTTMGVVVCFLYMKFRGNRQVVFWNRALGNDTVEKSTTLFIIALIFISVATFFLTALESLQVRNVYLSSLFEVTSAFGTVGLSTGITTALSAWGKLLLCVVMYTGRLGPLTIMSALTSEKKELNILYPEEHIMIG